jgi:predicted NUDIX family phosphoesterase
MADITSEDHERVKFLTLISSSKNEFNKLSLEQLARLQELLEKKDYSHDKKADKTKTKFLKRINVRIYELTEGRGIW